MSNNYQLFRTEYNKLHETMKQKAKNVKYKDSDVSFDTPRQHLLRYNATIRHYDSELVYINKLRNLLIHDERSIDYIIAEPSSEIIERIISIRKKITIPDDASNYCQNNVYTLNFNDSLIDTLKIVREKKISQFPLFSNKKLEGIISDNEITNWLSTKIEQDTITLKDVQIFNVLNKGTDELFDNYEIIPSGTLLFDVLEKFTNELKDGNNSFIILISETKKIKLPEEILGIITPWDIPTIRNKIEV